MTQTQPDSQKNPFTESQLAWIREKYGSANFRNPNDGATAKLLPGGKLYQPYTRLMKNV